VPDAGEIALASHLDLFQLDICNSDTSTTSNTVFATPTGMSGVSLAAGQTYFVHLNAKFHTAVATTGISLQATFSGTDGGSQFVGFIQTTATTTLSRVFFTANQASGWSSTDSAGATALIAQASGYITADTAGTLTLQFRSEVSGSSVTLRNNSHLHAMKTTLV
jgi:hypothetical protein